MTAQNRHNLNLLNSEDVLLPFDSVCHNVYNAENNNVINENLNIFCAVLDHVCTPLFKRVLNVNNSKINNVDKDKTCLDKECKELKQMYYRCLNYYRSNPCDETRVDMVQARSSYKNTVRKKKYVYDKKQTHTLESARFTHAKM